MSKRSGAQKRKITNEKKKKNEELMNKIPKLTTFMVSTTSCQMTGAPETDHSQIQGTSKTSSNDDNSSLADSETTTDTNYSESQFEFDDDKEEIAAERLNVRDKEDDVDDIDMPFSSDTANWNMEENLNFLQSYWAKHGSLLLFRYICLSLL